MVTQQILVLFFLVRIQVAQHHFCSSAYFFNGLWCNGNTTDSGPVFLGSNPGSPTEERSHSWSLFLSLISFVGEIHKKRIADDCNPFSCFYFFISSLTALIFSSRTVNSAFSFSTFLLYSFTRLFPFFEVEVKNPRLFS